MRAARFNLLQNTKYTQNKIGTDILPSFQNANNMACFDVRVGVTALNSMQTLYKTMFSSSYVIHNAKVKILI